MLRTALIACCLLVACGGPLEEDVATDRAALDKASDGAAAESGTVSKTADGGTKTGGGSGPYLDIRLHDVIVAN